MNLAAKAFLQLSSRQITDGLLVAAVATIPWSTSAATIFMVVWLLAILPTLRFSDLRNAAMTASGGLPLLLFACAALGMLWSDTSWSDSIAGLRQFFKLLFIPILLVYFMRSQRGLLVMQALVPSCAVLLVLSVISAAWPEPFLHWSSKSVPGVPLRNYITQSAEFAICAFYLFYESLDLWNEKRGRASIAAALLALAFIGDIIFIVSSRTELVVIGVLIVVFGAHRYGWKGAATAVCAFGLLAVVVWNLSSSVRSLVYVTEKDAKAYQHDREVAAPALESLNSTSYRIEFLRKALAIVANAPIIGHGTGSIESQFKRAAVGKVGIAAAVTSNPHNQTLAVGIQLGLVGVALLWAMWLAHALMFWRAGAPAFFGLVIVVQIVVGSLFNTHLFDFAEGWLYVGGVGALGSWCRRQAATAPA